MLSHLRRWKYYRTMPRLDVYPGFITKKTSFNPFMEVRCISEADMVESAVEVKSPSPEEVKDPFSFLPSAPKPPEPFSPFELPEVKVQPSKSHFSFHKQSNFEPTKETKAINPIKDIPLDQPRGKNGERLLYTYPHLPIISLGPSTEFTLLVGSSDKSGTAWLMQFDGAANPNPGPASSGAVLWSPKDASGYRSPVFEMGKFLGKATNNLAEIQGLLLGLKMAAARGARELFIEGDSELIIRQQTREYKVSNKNLKSWWAEIQAAMMDEISFDWIAIRHVRREFNERADSITKEVLSKREGFTRCG
jgi:ribonuclease HI